MFIAIIFPIIISILIGFINNTKLLKISTITALLIQFIVVLNVEIAEYSLQVWHLIKPLTITYKVDALGKFFAVAMSFIWLLVGIYSVEYMEHEENPNKFIMMYIMSLGSLMSLCFSANLMTMYMSFEIMALMTFPLVVHTRERDALRAGMKYIGYSVLGAGLGLIGFFFLQAYGISTEFVSAGVDLSSLTHEQRENIEYVAFIMLIGFSCKCGIFPLQGWLTSAHPVAPSPASAVLSGVITKAGVLCVVRIIHYIFGADFLLGTWVQKWYLILVISTIFMGSMLAYKEKTLKKRLAYSTISQVSYVLFGLILCNQIGFIGAMLHMIFHMFSKNLLFMCAGIIIHKTHTTIVSKYTGIGKRMPKLMVMFAVGSLSLIGIPPMAGFISKWFLAQGGLNAYNSTVGIVGVSVLLVSAVLTAGYLFSIVYNAFFVYNASYESENMLEAKGIIMLPIFVCSVALIYFGVYSYGLEKIIETIAINLF